MLLKRDLVDRLHRGSGGLPKYLNALAEDWLEECCDQGAFLAAGGPTEKPVQAFGVLGATPTSARQDVPADAIVSAMTALEALRSASSQALDMPERGVSDAKALLGSHPNHTQAASTDDQPSAGHDRNRLGEKSFRQRKARQKIQTAPSEDPVPVWNRPWFVPGVAVFSLFALLLPLVWQLPGSDDEDAPTRLRERSEAPRLRQAPIAPGIPSLGPQLPTLGLEHARRQELEVPSILSGNPLASTSAGAGAMGDESIESESVISEPVGDQSTRTELASGTDIMNASSNTAGGQQDDAEPNNEETESASDGLDRDWILQQSGQHFTIQLVATRSIGAARQHVAAFGEVDARFVPTRTKSQDFVVVLAGVYPARADAERALAKLPEALRGQGYWIRSVESVRQSLRD
ncbi:SPOR domain-containing protein [Thiorhodovibrio winogradskyi]|uniref:SPOR domain-containing protein n=1 Tax=Thiorhodovibrio winogradskyi TaxID=77007 RepID=UPI002E2E6BD1|nr:SPOR domain-containing protein [Thiorhodovibrio winogradskyi]